VIANVALARELAGLVLVFGHPHRLRGTLAKPSRPPHRPPGGGPRQWQRRSNPRSSYEQQPFSLPRSTSRQAGMAPAEQPVLRYPTREYQSDSACRQDTLTPWNRRLAPCLTNDANNPRRRNLGLPT